MTESDLWKMVRRAWDYAHLVRIESSSSFGLPDINVCCNGKEFWVELKVAHGNYFTLQPSQLAWTANRLKAGAKNLFILIGNEKTKGTYLCKSSELFRPGVVLNHGSVLKAVISEIECVSLDAMSPSGFKNLLNKIMFTFENKDDIINI